VPVGEAGEAFAEEGVDFGIGVGVEVESVFDTVEAVLAGGEVGDDGLIDEAEDEAFEGSLGEEMVAAVARFIDAADGAEVLEHAEPLADRAFAELEIGHNGVHGEGAGGR
jgi:hypothetical protein